MERQKPRKEREADAKAAEEAEAARKADAEREAAEAAAAGVAVADTGVPSRRALRHQQAAPVVDDAPDAGETAEAPSVEEPAVEAVPSSETEAPVAEPVLLETVAMETIIDDDAVDDSEPAPYTAPLIDVVPVGAASLAVDETGEHLEAVTVADDAPGTEGAVVEEIVFDEPAAAAAAESTPPLAPVFQGPSAPASGQPASPASSFDDLLSLRNTAAANSISTTSALVLPTIPGSNDVGTALDETGEVIITGSIDLPPSFGALGAPASGLESNDLDALLDRSEVETPGSDVAPVSAARAISTNTSSTSLITPPKRARANAPVVLAITAGVLAVGVVSLLLAVFVFRVF
ncbi:hypothetical protein N1031_11710 [Herbiconiux moechotypicola]|nr:hypothetical protein [Herbiconiux moechotypicola]MCS5730428.1 hypothetical protein [Herbiconiux moechotypicola]